MKPDLKKHRKPLTNYGYSETEIDEIISRISNILTSFIDAAWGIHPVQLSMKSNSQNSLCPTQGYAKLKTTPENTEKLHLEPDAKERKRIL